MADYEALMNFILDQVVENKDDMKLTVENRSRSTFVKVKVGETDMGKLIGKKGRHIEAIRTLLRAAALKDRRKVFVDII
ncbi:MAG: KH domain-containing protein [Candidatus Dormibacteria bacterium]